MATTKFVSYENLLAYTNSVKAKTDAAYADKSATTAALNSKASASDLTDVTGRVTTLETNINTKAAASDVTDLAGRVTTLEGSPTFTGTPRVAIAQENGASAVTEGEVVDSSTSSTGQSTATIQQAFATASERDKLSTKGFVVSAITALKNRYSQGSGAGYIGFNGTIQNEAKTTVRAALNALDAALTTLATTVSNIQGLNFSIVDQLPQSGVAGTIYLVRHTHGTNDVYDEYVWVPSTAVFEKIGNTDIDLSGYWQKSELEALSNSDVTTVVNAAWS